MMKHVARVLFAYTYHDDELLKSNGFDANKLRNILHTLSNGLVKDRHNIQLQVSPDKCTSCLTEKRIKAKYDTQWEEWIDEHSLGWGGDIKIGSKYNEYGYPNELLGRGGFEDDESIVKVYFVEQSKWSVTDRELWTRGAFPYTKLSLHIGCMDVIPIFSMSENNEFVIIINYNPKTTEFKQRIVDLKLVNDRWDKQIFTVNDLAPTKWVYHDIKVVDFVELYTYFPGIFMDLINDESIGAYKMLQNHKIYMKQ